jgi:hypothetical protein
VHFHSVRKRLADSDGISGKAALDGLVHAAILQDDSPKFVTSTTHSQEQGTIEETIITITPQPEIVWIEESGPISQETFDNLMKEAHDGQ